MRTIISVLFLLLLINLFATETNPVQQYFANPTAATFKNAWSFCNETLEKDSTSQSTIVMMATISNYESQRLVNSITPIASTLDAGNKFQFANILLSNEKYEQAIPLYQSLNDSLPNWSCPWRHKGTALFMLKNYKAAEVSLQKAVETNSEHYDAYIWLAKTQFQLKKYKIALTNLEIALKLNPEAEENNDEVLSEESIKTLHQALLKKNGK